MNPPRTTAPQDFTEEARRWVNASSVGISAEEEREGLSRLEQIPLEILPGALAIESHAVASRFAMKHASSSRALVLARNYHEFARRMNSALHTAIAAFHEAVALRRSNQFDAAEKLHFDALSQLDRLGSENQDALRARADLALDQAILAFQKKDFLESARMNLKASGFGLALKNSELQARALLNASISWERLNELENTRHSLNQGKQALGNLRTSPLLASYALFEWRFQMDHGPFPAAFNRRVLDLNHSQETLFRLYQWEYALCAQSASEIARAQESFQSHCRQIRNNQFESESIQLGMVTEFVQKGTRGMSTSSRAVLPGTDSLLSGSNTPEGYRACLAGWMRELLIERQWKKLEALTAATLTDSHPVIQSAALRAKAWLEIKQQNLSSASEWLARARKVAQENNLVSMTLGIRDDLNLLHPESAQAPSRELPPRQAEVRATLRSVIPDHTRRYLLVTDKLRRELTDANEAAAISHALAAQDLLFWDGNCGVIQIGRIGTRDTIELGSKPVLRRLLTAVFSSHPHAISKEDLVPLVWEEAYNPLVHDTLIHGAVSRLRRLLPRSHQSEFTWDSTGLKWTGVRPFAAWMPMRGATRTLAEDTKLSSRQIRILTLLKYKGSLSKADVIRSGEFSERTAVRELAGLVRAKLVLRSGMGRATRYFPFSG
ncbi:MAG: hypothetical protein A2X94_04925 [Bdellovibrionales bacterium GWB1_55_8]|nr:MAG: hypothetical protein A2X94_04925 [Bdellovibrionales bacterium GWB1_55_8]